VRDDNTTSAGGHQLLQMLFTQVRDARVSCAIGYFGAHPKPADGISQRRWRP
jgi:hypothetical protein